MSGLVDGSGLKSLGIVGNESLALANLPALSLLASGEVSHFAAGVVRVVGFGAVGTGDWVDTCGPSGFAVLLVDVGVYALLTVDVVGRFFVVSSALAASDRAVRMDLVPELPASGALDEVDFFRPFGGEYGGVEEEKGLAGECV